MKSKLEEGTEMIKREPPVVEFGGYVTLDQISFGTNVVSYNSEVNDWFQMIISVLYVMFLS